MTDGSRPLPIGTKLGNLEIRDILGIGGFAITYLAYDATLGASFAVKEYFPANVATREADLSVHARSDGIEGGFAWGMEKFMEEAKVLVRLKHPSIVRIFQVFGAFDTAYFTMELLEGPSLKEHIQRRLISNQTAFADIFEPLLDALQFVHSYSVIHRDIAPKNIILQAPTARPVLFDFGAVIPVGQNDQFAAILTPGYAPFEQYVQHSTNNMGPWTDIYALAGTMYETITGSLPPEAPERMHEDRYQPLARRKLKGFDPALLAAIDWGLSPAPIDRPQSIDEWRKKLLPADTARTSSGTPRRARRVPEATKIFISYRRSDAHHVAGRIYDHLAKEFGDDNLFFDVDSIPYGVDFRDHIDVTMATTAVVLAIVGSNWVNSAWRKRRWLPWRSASLDFVQIEIEQALELAVPIIPLLIDGTEMPSGTALPSAMKEFAYLNASSVRGGRDFRADMDRVVTAIRAHLPQPETPSAETSR